MRDLIKFILTLAAALLAIAYFPGHARPVQAQGRCSGERPYYHYVETGPGALIADVFLFAFSAPAAVAVAPLSPKALCMPVALLVHYKVNKPERKR